MPVFFLGMISIPDNKRAEYDDYIKLVKPIAEKYGGEYIIGSERITALTSSSRPDRVILIKYNTRTQLNAWISSEEYKEIQKLQEDSIFSSAIIIEE